MGTQNKSAAHSGIVVIALIGIFGVAAICVHTQNPQPESSSTATHAAPIITPQMTSSAATSATTLQTTTTSANNWMLTLVNSTHPLPDAYRADIELVQLFNGTTVDARIYPALQSMFDDMRREGVYPIVREGYRTYEDQVEILLQRIQEYIAQGYAEQEAQQLALDYVAKPGTSEHELGLAVDINAAPGSGCSGETVYAWLAEHAYRYGFILRYPQGKSDITGISYEPWHYRYVGTEAAAEITEAQITLEEYLGAC